MVVFCRGHFSRWSKLRKLSPPSRPKTSSIVLDHTKRVGIVVLCVWCSSQLGALKASLVRVSPSALACLLRGSPRSRFTCMKISKQVSGSIFTFMEVGASFKGPKCMKASNVGGSGCFHCFHQLQLPRICSVEASMRLHIPLHTSIYFREYHKPPAASTVLTLTLTLSWSYLHGSWPTSNFHGSRWEHMVVVGCFHGSWSYLIEASSHGSRCELMEAVIEVD